MLTYELFSYILKIILRELLVFLKAKEKFEMKKGFKKFIVAGAILTTSLGLTACGSKDKDKDDNKTPETTISYELSTPNTVYELDDKFSLTGLKLIGSDGNEIAITRDMIKNMPDMSIAGEKTIEVIYNGTTYSFKITVKADPDKENLKATLDKFLSDYENSQNKGDATVTASYNLATKYLDSTSNYQGELFNEGLESFKNNSELEYNALMNFIINNTFDKTNISITYTKNFKAKLDLVKTLNQIKQDYDSIDKVELAKSILNDTIFTQNRSFYTQPITDFICSTFEINDLGVNKVTYLVNREFNNFKNLETINVNKFVVELNKIIQNDSYSSLIKEYKNNINAIVESVISLESDVLEQNPHTLSNLIRALDDLVVVYHNDSAEYVEELDMYLLQYGFFDISTDADLIKQKSAYVNAIADIVYEIESVDFENIDQLLTNLSNKIQTAMDAQANLNNNYGYIGFHFYGADSSYKWIELDSHYTFSPYYELYGFEAYPEYMNNEDWEIVKYYVDEASSAYNLGIAEYLETNSYIEMLLELLNEKYLSENDYYLTEIQINLLSDTIYKILKQEEVDYETLITDFCDEYDLDPSIYFENYEETGCYYFFKDLVETYSEQTIMDAVSIASLTNVATYLDEIIINGYKSKDLADLIHEFTTDLYNCLKDKEHISIDGEGDYSLNKDITLTTLKILEHLTDTSNDFITNINNCIDTYKYEIADALTNATAYALQTYPNYDNAESKYCEKYGLIIEEIGGLEPYNSHEEQDLLIEEELDKLTKGYNELNIIYTTFVNNYLNGDLDLNQFKNDITNYIDSYALEEVKTTAYASGSMLATMYYLASGEEVDFNELFNFVELPEEIASVDFNVLVNKILDGKTYEDFIKTSGVNLQYITNEDGDIVKEILTIDVLVDYDIMVTSVKGNVQFKLEIEF